MNRPEIRRLRDLVNQGEIDCVVVRTIDRLSRNIVDAVNLVLKEWDGRCYIKSATEPIDTTTDLGRVIFGILAMFADFERSQIKSRLHSAKELKLREGLQMHSSPAYGYMMHPTEKGCWVENPEESPIVRRIFAMAIDGIGMTRIAKQLNSEGIPTRNGATWSQKTVRLILSNRTYIGELMYGRTTAVPIDAPDEDGTVRRRFHRLHHDTPKIHVRTSAASVLIDESTFNDAQFQIAQNHRYWNDVGSRALGSPHLLSGITKCRCGAPYLCQNRKNGKSYYLCDGKRRGLCDSGMLPAPDVENIVETAFLNEFKDSLSRQDYFLPQIERIEKERESVIRSLRVAERSFADLDDQDKYLLKQGRTGKIDLSLLKDLRDSVAQERESLTLRISELRATAESVNQKSEDVQHVLESLDLLSRWNTLDVHQKRFLIKLVLRDRITMWRPRRDSGQPLVIDFIFPWAGEKVSYDIGSEST